MATALVGGVRMGAKEFEQLCRECCVAIGATPLERHWSGRADAEAELCLLGRSSRWLLGFPGKRISRLFAAELARRAAQQLRWIWIPARVNEMIASALVDAVGTFQPLQLRMPEWTTQGYDAADTPLRYSVYAWETVTARHIVHPRQSRARLDKMERGFDVGESGLGIWKLPEVAKSPRS